MNWQCNEQFRIPLAIDILLHSTKLKKIQRSSLTVPHENYTDSPLFLTISQGLLDGQYPGYTVLPPTN